MMESTNLPMDSIKGHKSNYVNKTKINSEVLKCSGGIPNKVFVTFDNIKTKNPTIFYKFVP